MVNYLKLKDVNQLVLGSLFLEYMHVLFVPLLFSTFKDAYSVYLKILRYPYTVYDDGSKNTQYFKCTGYYYCTSLLCDTLGYGLNDAMSCVTYDGTHILPACTHDHHCFRIFFFFASDAARFISTFPAG